MHVVEGQYGSVQAFVIPQTCPRVCKAAVHTIKPLCMHHRLNAWEGTVPMNELQITGESQNSVLCDCFFNFSLDADAFPHVFFAANLHMARCFATADAIIQRATGHLLAGLH